MAAWLNTIKKRWSGFLQRRTISQVIIAAILAVIVFPYSIASALLLRHMYMYMSQELMNSQKTVLYETTYLMETIIDVINYSTTKVYLDDQIKKDLTTILSAGDTAEEYYAVYEINDKLNELANSILYTINTQMAIIDRNGRFITMDTIGRLEQPLDSFSWYEEVRRAAGLPYWDPAIGHFFDKDAGEYDGLGSARMLYNSAGVEVGVVVVYIPANAFWSRVKALNLSYRGDIFIISDQDRLIASDSGKRPEYLFDGFVENITSGAPNAGLSIREFDMEDNYSGLLLSIGKTRFYLVNEVSRSAMLADVNNQISAVFLLLVLLFAAFTMVALWLARMISRPITALTHTVQRLEKGEHGLRMPPSGFLETHTLSDSFNQLLDTTDDLLEKVQHEAALREEAHFEALRAQINPHFLFNTLNSIRWMATINADEKTADMIADLARILENTLTRNGRMPTLGEELDILESYFNIQQMRYGNAIAYENHVPEMLWGYRIPKFILQPIIENAIIHGLSHKPDGKITLNGQLAGGYLELTVRDNGVGAEEGMVATLLTVNRASKSYMTGIGIKNVHERLRIQFGEDCGLMIKSAPLKGFLVTIRLPAILAANEEEIKNG